MDNLKAGSIRVPSIQHAIATIAIAAIDPAKEGIAIELSVGALDKQARPRMCAAA
jgi:hypothetical protein